MLPRSARLTTTLEISRVVRRGGRFRSGSLILHHLPDSKPARFAFIVPKAIGNAPMRNLVKRRLRELVRPFAPGLRGEFVLRVSQSNTRLTWLVLSSDFELCLQKALVSNGANVLRHAQRDSTLS